LNQEPRHFDVRTLAHRLRRGEITQAEVDAYLAALPDDSADGAETSTRFEAPFLERALAEGASLEPRHDDEDE
jgi:hypothetical protein